MVGNYPKLPDILDNMSAYLDALYVLQKAYIVCIKPGEFWFIDIYKITDVHPVTKFPFSYW